MIDKINNFFHADLQNHLPNHLSNYCFVPNSVETKIFEILNDPLLNNSIDNNSNDNISKSSLSEQTKNLLIEYSNNKKVHPIFNITFKELLDYVWTRIMNHDQHDEILKVLDQRMKSGTSLNTMMCKLIECLNIFDSKPENFINIPDAIEI